MHSNRTLTLVAVCLGSFMLIIDVMIVVVALPSIHAALHTSFATEQWTIDAYSLSLASMLLLTGSLADILGRRRVFAGGLAVFTAGSLLCGLAGSGVELVVFRALQGIGGAAAFATSLALLVQTFEGRALRSAIGLWSAVLTLAMGAGPVVGGLLTTDLSWRWIFFVNVPLGIAAIAMTLAGVRETPPTARRRLDLPGGAVFTLGLLALIFGLIESSSHGWGSGRVVAALVVATVALLSFPAVEHARSQPMFDLALLRVPTFGGGLVAAVGLNGSIYASLLYLVLYLQDDLHDSALGTGLRLLVLTGGAMATSLAAGRLAQHVPVRGLVGGGLAVTGAGLLLMRGVHAGSPWTHLILGFLVAGAGSGLVTPALASTAVGVVAPADAGMASGVNATFRQVGISVSVAVLGSVWTASGLNAVLLIAGCIALAAGGLAFALIRARDFRVSPDGPSSPAGSPHRALSRSA